jgi:SPP1 family phage portal protein
MSKELLELIKQDKELKTGSLKYAGRKYYTYNPIMNLMEDDYEYYIKDNMQYKVKNNKKNEIYINYFKMLVTQKIDYLLSKKPSYDKQFDNQGFNVFTMLDTMILNSSLDSRSWLHVYISNNKYQYIVVKDMEIIPYYSPDGKILNRIIRYYNEIDKLDKKEILHIEDWTLDGVKRYAYKNNTILDESIDSHYVLNEYTGDQLEQSVFSNFPMIPFIPLWNNKDHTSDLYDIHCLIVAYNSIATGFIDNIKKFQEALMILRGYIGDKESIKKIMREMQESKGISVDKDGDAGYITVDIPVEARQVLMDILRDVIFLLGRGVDPSKLAEGTNITNTVIKSRYIQLNFKGADCIKRVIEFYDKFIEFMNMVTPYTFNNDLEFNISMLINESDVIENCLKSQNMVSQETILKNHPWVEDPKEELKKVNEEEKERQKLYDDSLFNINDKNKNKNKNDNNK